MKQKLKTFACSRCSYCFSCEWWCNSLFFFFFLNYQIVCLILSATVAGYMFVIKPAQQISVTYFFFFCNGKSSPSIWHCFLRDFTPNIYFICCVNLSFFFLFLFLFPFCWFVFLPVFFVYFSSSLTEGTKTESKTPPFFRSCELRIEIQIRFCCCSCCCCCLMVKSKINETEKKFYFLYLIIPRNIKTTWLINILNKFFLLVFVSSSIQTKAFKAKPSQAICSLLTNVASVVFFPFEQLNQVKWKNGFICFLMC